MPFGFLGGRDAQSIQKPLFGHVAQMLFKEYVVYLYEASQAHVVGSLNTAFIFCEISLRKNPTQRTIHLAKFTPNILV